MSSRPASTGEATATLLAALDRTLETVVATGAARTSQGKDIDAHQPQAERVAYFATEVRAVKCLAGYAAGEGRAEPHVDDMALLFAAEIASKAAGQLDAHAGDLGLDPAFVDATLATPAVRAAIRAGMADARVTAIGRRQLESRGVNNSPVDELSAMTRDAVRQFATTEVAPLAEHIHRHDDLVPDALIAKMAELGYFGMAVPEAYGGGGMGNLAMIITTEELSAVSLAAAGSLITRPEILTKALVKGGTDRQKSHWLPPIAAGKVMVGVSVTEPDTGSDVASITCRAEPVERDGKQGWVVNGAKAWCTFAGRANVLALLARTDPDPTLGAKGLSLFIVPKDTFPGHAFEMKQPAGGFLTGKADATPGYRGMHSFTLMFDQFFVPGENLVGEAGGVGKGFYLQMAGFAAGRLQTGGRATGLAQAALQRTCEYANDRKQFGKPIGHYGLTQYKLGRMAAHIAAARQLTYTAARLMDENESIALEPAMAKLFASDVAVWVTQEGQQLHGGWGYAEEFPISRYVVDATVLPIFEGVKPILELKVIARNLLG
ncbi:MAG: acyl-CoA dehydrogenase family protein [Deltaproteobacteria bacterium]|nr:acyl-CoA dehydrogenase family protein [Deltaproteobacteria bacterium]